MGQKALTSAETFVEDLQLQGKLTPEEFLQQRDAALHALFPKAEFMPGAALPRDKVKLRMGQAETICVVCTFPDQHSEHTHMLVPAASPAASVASNRQAQACAAHAGPFSYMACRQRTNIHVQRPQAARVQELKSWFAT